MHNQTTPNSDVTMYRHRVEYTSTSLQQDENSKHGGVSKNKIFQLLLSSSLNPQLSVQIFQWVPKCIQPDQRSNLFGALKLKSH